MIRVLVVDDSALVRKVLTEALSAQPGIAVVGAAPDPLVAREMIRRLDPDVITLDVEMPRMHGLEFLERLMRLRPTPVVMVSSLTERGSDTTLRALELGAVDFVAKPTLDVERGLAGFAGDLAEKVRAAATARLRRPAPPDFDAPQGRPVPAPPAGRARSTEKLVVIGASTGGTVAIRDILAAMPADGPAILIVQHMPENFTRSFAQRLDGCCRIRVKEATHGERVLPGHAYVAPGHSHLLLARSGADYVVELGDGPPVNRHRPSVDVLFGSVASRAAGNAIGVILTGMGRDGAAGLREMRDAGAHTIAQDEASCVVFGMPREAIAAEGAVEVLPLDGIAGRLLAKLAASGRGAVRI